MSVFELHLLTACTRPENLPAIACSIETAQRDYPVVRLHWHIALDPLRQAVGGQRRKNELLDGVTDGWIYVLDDDTLLAPSLIWTLQQRGFPRALVVSQRRHDGVGGGLLRAAPENVRPGSIDIGQLLLHRSLVGDERLPEQYDGDGLFVEALYRRFPAEFVFAPEVVIDYNALRRS